MKWIKQALLIFGIALLSLISVGSGSRAIVYTTVTDITTSELPNAIQIMVKADGILEWKPEGAESFYTNSFGGNENRISLRLTNARSSVKNFIDVGLQPVSHVQTCVPADAKDGVGLSLVVAFFNKANFDVTGSPDRQSLIITVKTERTLQKREKGSAGAAQDSKSVLSCHCENGCINLLVLKQDMLSVLSEIAE